MDKLIVIRTGKEIDDLLIYLEDKEIVAVDCETTGLQKGAEIIGWSICAEIGAAYYVVCAEWDLESSALRYLETKNRSSEVMEVLKTKQLIMHNAVFDCAKVNENYGIDLMPSLLSDTLVMAHLVNENSRIGLKELAVSIYGQDSIEEQIAMKESVARNGGSLTKANYEIYKADSELMAKYGAKDTILTWNLFYHFLEELGNQNLLDFFFEESMPLLRGPTYDLNTVGLKVDVPRVASLKSEMELEALNLKYFIHKEITPHVEEKYPGTNDRNTFNVGSSQQISWLLFEKLGNTFSKLTDSGRALAKYLRCSTYYAQGKREFIAQVKEMKGGTWINEGKSSKIRDPWTYISTDEGALNVFSSKYKWVASLLKLREVEKMLGTYVTALVDKTVYGVIYPNFKQCGTTSGRYSCSEPNFQNLPREDKRIKSCIISRPGRVFVGADYAQLEPRVFASISQDESLMNCFASGKDFYSVVGAPIFGVTNCSMVKGDDNSFAKKHPELREKSKVISLATPYGRTARQQASVMGISEEESQALIQKYFQKYPKVELMMLKSHEKAMLDGVAYNLYGRPRRIPEAKKIKGMYGNVPHDQLEYSARTLLNLAMNHEVQSTAASIANRAAIKFLISVRRAGLTARLVLQVHDELVAECEEREAEAVSILLKDAMENAAILPGVALVAEPKIGHNLAELK